MFHWIASLISGAAALATAAFAQAPAPAPASASTTSATSYRSVFDDYRPFKDADRRSWSESNAEAGLLGGHAGQLKAAAPSARAVPESAGPGAASVQGAPESSTVTPAPAIDKRPVADRPAPPTAPQGQRP